MYSSKSCGDTEVMCHKEVVKSKAAGVLSFRTMITDCGADVAAKPSIGICKENEIMTPRKSADFRRAGRPEINGQTLRPGGV